MTLDDDVARQLEREIRRSGESLKITVNRLLREALAAPPATPPEPFVVEARALGLPTGLDYDDVESLLDRAEGQWRR